MNKIILKITTAFMLFGTLSSCDLLDQYPVTSPGVDDVYINEAGVYSVLAGCYQAWQTTGGYNIWAIESGSNSVWNRTGITVNSNYFGHIGGIGTTHDATENCHDTIYKAAARVNDLLDNLDGASISDEVREQIRGEAYFLRAHTYLYAVRYFGRVPLVTEPVLSIDDANVPRASLREIYEQIIEDLKLAEQLMPTKEQQSAAGRSQFPHATAATAYLAKTYLNMYYLTETHFDATKEAAEDRFTESEQKQFLQNAYDYAKEVYTSGNYQLATTYAELFNNKSKNSVESIFEMQYGSSYGQTNQITARTGCTKTSNFFPNYTTNTLNSRMRPSRMLFAEHWTKYGQMGATTAGALQTIVSNSIANMDPRINVSYLYYNDANSSLDMAMTTPIWPNMSVSLHTTEDNLPYYKKYWYDEFNGSGGHNIIVMRYAEVLLILADAANELDLTTEAITYIDELLDRAADENGNGQRDSYELKPEKWSTTLSKEEVREAIRFEKEFELPLEGHDFFEFRMYGWEWMVYLMEKSNYWRNIMVLDEADGGWGRTSSYYHASDLEYTSSYLTEDFCKKNIYAPYPTTEIQLNTAISQEDQNYGWEYK